MSNHTKLTTNSQSTTATRKGWAKLPANAVSNSTRDTGKSRGTVTARKYIPKTKKPTQKDNNKPTKKRRPKPSDQYLCDFITRVNKKKKPRKKLTWNQKVLRLENAFKIKEELNKHPFIIKQQKMREKRIEKRRKNANKIDNNHKEEKMHTKEVKMDKKVKPKPIVKKQYSSQKKHIKHGRIHKGVVDVVEYLVNTVCEEGNAQYHGLTKKQIKNREKRQRKKEMDKLKKIQPDLMTQRNAWKESHCGSHATVMKYSDIRSYSEHLVSDELNDRVGFLLNKLSQVMEEHQPNEAGYRKLFLCGMKECLKTLKAKQEDHNVNVVGVIMSSQMEPLPEWSGLDRMIDNIKQLCKDNGIHIIFTLNRKQLNYILKLKPWQGNVSCVTLLDVNIYQQTWKRIVLIKEALREQYLMLQHDFIPIYRAISVKPRHVPPYQMKVEEKEIEKEEQIPIPSAVEQEGIPPKRAPKVVKESALSATAAPWQPIHVPPTMPQVHPPNVFLYPYQYPYSWRWG